MEEKLENGQCFRLTADNLCAVSVCELIWKSIGFVENEKETLHYHTEIHVKDGHVELCTFYGDKKRQLERPGQATCATCHPENQTVASLIGVSKDYQDAVFEQKASVLKLGVYPHSTMSFDAKGRNLLIFTPNEHVDRFTECRSGIAPLISEMLEAAPTLQSIVVNQGNYQNHPHLHFKVRFTDWHSLLTDDQAALQSRLREAVRVARAENAIGHSHTMT